MSSAALDNNIDKPVHQHTDLSRQMTVQLSPEQYQRLFFQPTPAKGDLAKRLGTRNPPFRRFVLIRHR